MACYWLSHYHISSWLTRCLGNKSLLMHGVGRSLCNFNRLHIPYPISVCHVKGFANSSQSLQQDVARFPSVSSHGNVETPTEGARRIGQCLFVNPIDSTGKAVNNSPSNGRVMLIDGTAVIYRAYYKLLAKLHHGYLSHADGNGDWVMTIFTALSLIIDVLEFVPSHVAVVFDHMGEIPIQHFVPPTVLYSVG